MWFVNAAWENWNGCQEEEEKEGRKQKENSESHLTVQRQKNEFLGKSIVSAWVILLQKIKSVKHNT